MHGFFSFLLENFKYVRKFATRITMFGSTCVFKQLFSLMKSTENSENKADCSTLVSAVLTLIRDDISARHTKNDQQKVVPSLRTIKTFE